MSHKHDWDEAQKEELAFWDNCANTLGEELKQLVYAEYMGLEFQHNGNTPYNIDKKGLKILDVGGGPVSLLLKTDSEGSIVIDPCNYPNWVRTRYGESHISLWNTSGERFFGADFENEFDEVWMYNVLQHTEDPGKIIRNIYMNLKQGGVFRFFDWIETPINGAHPITLTAKDIRKMLADAGFNPHQLLETKVNKNQAIGKAAYGIFTIHKKK